MARIQLIITILLSSLTAFAVTPVKTVNASQFDEKTRKAVDAHWDELYADDIKNNIQNYEYNPKECAIFRAYTVHLLRKLISSSKLESHTRDLYLNMDCYNVGRFPLGAKLIGRTLSINQGYFGSLDTEDTLAALLAHELSHHILRHEDSYEPYRKKVTTVSGFTDIFGSRPRPSAEMIRAQLQLKIHEDEADVNSISILANAGESYTGAVRLIEFVKANAFGTSPTHSGFQGRINMMVAQASSLKLSLSPEKPFPPEILENIKRYFSNEVLDLYQPGSRRRKVYASAQ